MQEGKELKRLRQEDRREKEETTKRREKEIFLKLCLVNLTVFYDNQAARAQMTKC